MHAQYLIVNKSCHREAVETIGEYLPELDIVSPFTLIVESINAVHRCTFVVASQEEEVLWVLDFVREEKANCFQALLSAINIISQEQVV